MIRSVPVATAPRLAGGHALLRLGCLVALLAPGLVGCDDDPTHPPPHQDWVAVTLDPSLPDGGLWSAASDGGRTLVVGVTRNGSYLLERDGEAWNRVGPQWPADTFLFDVALDPNGRAVVVGGSPGEGQVFVGTESPTFAPTSRVQGNGVLQTVLRRDAGSFLASGYGSGGLPAVNGTLDGAWSYTTIPTPGGAGEKSIVDLVESQGVVFACGFDDAAAGTPASPFQMLLRDAGSGFEVVDTPCGACGNRDFRALAVAPDGGLLLGGATLDFSAGAPDASVALLWYRAPAGGGWTELLVPDAGPLDRVNAILVTADGSIVLACGGDLPAEAALVRLPASGGAIIEYRRANVEVLGLAETDAGEVLALGVDERGGAPRPLLLRRVL